MATGLVRRMAVRRTMTMVLPASLIFGLGCATGSIGGNTVTPAPATIAITISGAAQTRLGQTAQFSAVVANSSNQAVTWQVNGTAGGSAASGTISSTGLYTAPTALPSGNAVTVGAVSQASASASSTMSEAIWNPTPVMTGATATQVGTTSAYLIDVLGTSFVTGAQIQVGGAAVTTTVKSANELTATYTPATGATSASISVMNPAPGASTSASVTTQFKPAGVISLTVAGAAQTRLGQTTQFTATVANSANQAVNWQVNGTTGGSAANGTISSAGLYTAPAALPSGNAVTITAISQASSAATAAMSEAIWNPLPVMTSEAATQSTPSGPFLIDVQGTGFVPGAQIQVGGSAIATNFISGTDLQANYTPASGTTSAALSVLNPAPGSSVSASANVTLLSVKASVATAGRLLDQATFGPTATDIQHVQAVGVDAYLTEQFAATPTLLADIPNPAPVHCSTVPRQCEQSEWWAAAMTGPDQLRQRVAFALAEMFVVSTNSVSPYAVTPYQNLLVNDAFGNFATVMKDVSLSTAMGAYLNMLNSAKPAVINGVPQIANENYSRELMQLFTIGLYQLNQDGTPQLDGSGNMIPSYTQAQVQAFARAYTGWTYAGGTAGKFPNGTADFDDPMVAVEAYHDTAAKILLNGTTLPAGQTAQQDLNGALGNIFNHSNVAPFVCRQLIQHLVASNPSAAYVGRVSAVFNNNGNGVRGDLKAVIRAILLDSEARAGDTDPTQNGGHLREPILYLTGIMRGLGYTNTDPGSYYDTMNNYTAPLGQTPYASPSVFNFFPPEYIIPDSGVNAPEFALENTASAILRLTLANQLVFNQISAFKVDLSATSGLGLMAANPGNLVDALGVIFMHGQMPANMRSAIVNHIGTLSDLGMRVRVATYLVITSSQYKIVH